MAEKEIAVKVQDLTKSFKIPLEASSGIKQKLINTLKGRKGYREFTPLKDISFEIEKGDFFGIVGRNGSGKSTLLKTIAGIYAPDKGLVDVKGKLVPFIELGVGFNPELTGRENIFLNGALLGFSHKEMETMYDEIVEFAEIGDFMEEKLKNYSSGMQVRLAFSIAIRAKGDILLLDEVLAVGDEAFQKKSLSVFEKYKARKQTIILVTHDMGVVEKYCTRALMIDSGEVVKIGKPADVAQLYSNVNESSYTEARKVEVLKREQRKKNAVMVKIKNDRSVFEHGDKLELIMKWDNPSIKNVGVALLRQSGEYIFGVNTVEEKIKVDDKTINYTVDLNLGVGEYNFTIGVFGDSIDDPIDFLTEEGSFSMRDSKMGWGGVTELNHNWSN